MNKQVQDNLEDMLGIGNQDILDMWDKQDKEDMQVDKEVDKEGMQADKGKHKQQAEDRCYKDIEWVQ